MIVDSSALLAILLRQRDHERLLDALAAAQTAGVGAPTLAETGIVFTARVGPSATTLLARFVDESGLVVIPFGEEHWDVAIGAYARFGKGRHPARLNFGDCLTYAVARLADEPLLCLGDDFAKTDIALAEL